MQLWNSSEFQILCSISIQLSVSGLKLDSREFFGVLQCGNENLKYLQTCENFDSQVQ